MSDLRWLIGLLLMLLSISQAGAQTFPSPWPWRGVSIENLDYEPSKLREITRQININFVQLRLRPRKLSKLQHITPGEAWKESLAWGDQMLDQCAALGLVAMMTIEGFPINPDVPYKQTSEQFWRNGKDLNDVVHLAAELARHFSGRGDELAGYQLLSETVIIMGRKAVRPANGLRLQQRIISAIRMHDQKRWIAVSPGPWGGPNSYDDFKPLKEKRIIYGAHMYYPHAFTHQGIRQWSTPCAYPGEISGSVWDKSRLAKSMQVLRDFQRRYDVPVWIGEFSAIRWAKGGEKYLKDLASIFNAYGWSWTYFSMNGWHGWMPDYNQEYGMRAPREGDRQLVAKQKVGFESVRWKTLREIFGVPNQ